MKEFLDPDKILDELDLKGGETVVEFGCGSGSFTLPLAKKLKGGRVYALDIQEEPLLALKGKIEMAGLSNIETKRCDIEAPEGTGLPQEFLDWVFIPNVLFQVQDKQQVLKEAKRILKKGGKILIIDWKKNVPFGPKEQRVEIEDLKKIANDLKLKLGKEFQAGEYHFGLIFEKEK